MTYPYFPVRLYPLVAAGAVLLTSCQTTQTTSQSPSPSPSPVATPSDVAGTDIKFGPGFYPLEHFRGQTFRWADNDAQITLCSSGEPQKLDIDLEQGPSIGSKTMPLTVFDESGHQQRFQISNRHVVSVSVPSAPSIQTLTLHVQSRRVPVPREKRTLNFRVFKVSERTAGSCKVDVANSPELALGKKWYPLESGPSGSFRWVNNDAQVLVKKLPQSRALLIDAEPGPGQAGQPLRIALRKPDGATIATAKPIAGRQFVTVTLPPGTTAVALHTDDGGENIPSDTRTLNFRVFSLRLAPEPREAKQPAAKKPPSR